MKYLFTSCVLILFFISNLNAQQRETDFTYSSFSFTLDIGRKEIFKEFDFSKYRVLTPKSPKNSHSCTPKKEQTQVFINPSTGAVDSVKIISCKDTLEDHSLYTVSGISGINAPNGTNVRGMFTFGNRLLYTNDLNEILDETITFQYTFHEKIDIRSYVQRHERCTQGCTTNKLEDKVMYDQLVTYDYNVIRLTIRVNFEKDETPTVNLDKKVICESDFNSTFINVMEITNFEKPNGALIPDIVYSLYGKDKKTLIRDDIKDKNVNLTYDECKDNRDVDTVKLYLSKQSRSSLESELAECFFVIKKDRIIPLIKNEDLHDVCMNDYAQSYTIENFDEFSSLTSTVTGGNKVSEVDGVIEILWDKNQPNHTIELVGLSDKACHSGDSTYQLKLLHYDTSFTIGNATIFECDKKVEKTITLSNTEADAGNYFLFKDGTIITSSSKTADDANALGQLTWNVNESGIYTVKLRTESCDDFNMQGSVTLNYDEVPRPQPSISGDQAYCIGLPLNLTAETDYADVGSWQWVIENESGKLDTLKTVVGNTLVNYVPTYKIVSIKIQYINTSGCYSEEKNLNIPSLDKILKSEEYFAKADGDTIQTGSIVRFTTNIEAKNYEWLFSNGHKSYLKNPYLVFNEMNIWIYAELKVKAENTCFADLKVVDSVYVYDKNKEFQKFSTEEIIITENQTKMVLSPNPTRQHEVTLSFVSALDEEISIKMVSVSGREIVSDQKFSVSKGKMEIKLDTRPIKCGYYVLLIEGKQWKKTISYSALKIE